MKIIPLLFLTSLLAANWAQAECDYDDFPLMPDMLAAGIPPHWAVYFKVADCDATVEAARANGGRPTGMCASTSAVSSPQTLSSIDSATSRLCE